MRSQRPGQWAAASGDCDDPAGRVCVGSVAAGVVGFARGDRPAAPCRPLPCHRPSAAWMAAVTSRSGLEPILQATRFQEKSGASHCLAVAGSYQWRSIRQRVSGAGRQRAGLWRRSAVAPKSRRGAQPADLASWTPHAWSGRAYLFSCFSASWTACIGSGAAAPSCCAAGALPSGAEAPSPGVAGAAVSDEGAPKPGGMGGAL